MLKSGKGKEKPHITMPCAILPSQAFLTGPPNKYIAYKAAGMKRICCKEYKCSQSKAPFLNIYPVMPNNLLPDKKSRLQTNSGIAPKHNSAKAQKGLLNNNARPKMIKV